MEVSPTGYKLLTLFSLFTMFSLFTLFTLFTLFLLFTLLMLFKLEMHNACFFSSNQLLAYTKRVVSVLSHCPYGFLTPLF